MSTPHAVAVTTGALPDDVGALVEALAAAVSAHDRAGALSEDALLRLRTGGPGVTHLALPTPDGSGLIGYAQLFTASDDEDPAASGGGGLEGELLVHPAQRGHGAGRALLTRVEELAAGRTTLLWSHGDTPGAAALAASAGWTRSRELLRMERPVAGLPELAEPVLPDGVLVRPFAPGADDAAWVALNAAAFASHPEQGRWGVEDLLLRQREPWFDPSVFLLAQLPTGELAGSCWMKVEEHAAELYVLGVAPGRGGRGLGRALLVRGLHAIARPGGPDVVELYVDGDNEPAVRLYTGLGFARAAVDVQYRSPGAR